MTLRDVRDAGAAGAGLVAFDASLSAVVWANVPGRGVFGLGEGETALPATSVAARQIKASARLIDTWGEARILIRSTVGRSSKAVVATLRRIESDGLVLLTLPDLRPVAASDKALATALLADSGLDDAAVYAADGVLAASPAFDAADTEMLDTAVAALLASGGGTDSVDGRHSRMVLAQVAKGLVLVERQPLPAEVQAEAGEPVRANAPERSLFSVKRRKLAGDRSRISMNGLLQRWHTRQSGAVLPGSLGGSAADEEVPASETSAADRGEVADIGESEDVWVSSSGEAAREAMTGSLGNPAENLPAESDPSVPVDEEPEIAPSGDPGPGAAVAEDADEIGALGHPEPTADEEVPPAEPPILHAPVLSEAAPIGAILDPVAADDPAEAAETPAEVALPGAAKSLPPLSTELPEDGADVSAKAVLDDTPRSPAGDLAVSDATIDPPSPELSEPADSAADASFPPVPLLPLSEQGADPAGRGVAFVPRFDMAPVRFVWQIDRDGKFRSLTPEFSAAVGPRAADVAGRSFREVATVFGFDDGGEIARLLDRRDTWSGRSILWPVEASDRKVPVDLAALPIYARDRSFDGFRGFGIVRMNEWVVDPEAIGHILSASPKAAEYPASVGAAEDETPEAQPDQTPLTDVDTAPFGRRQTGPAESRGQATPASEVAVPVEVDAASETPKVIRLEERRRPREGALSQAEEAAFRAIGRKLGENGEATPSAGLTPPATAAEDEPEVLAEPVVTEATLEADGFEDVPADRLDVDDPQPDVTEGATDDDAPTDVAAEDVPLLDPPLDPPAEASLPEPEPAEPALASPAPVRARTSPWASGPVAELDEPTPLALPTALNEADASEAGAEGDDASSDDVPEADADFGPYADAAPRGSAEGDAAADEAEAAEETADRAALAAELEGVFSSLPLPVLAEAHGLLLYANREFQDLTGYESIAALETAGGLEGLFVERNDPLQTGQLAIRRSNGHTVDVRVHMQRATFSGRSCLLMSFTPSPRDAIAAVHPAPEPDAAPDTADLRQQVEELQAVLDTATDGVVLLDPAGSIRAMNGSAHALFGIDQNDHGGRHLSSLFAHESQKATLDYLDMLRDDGLAGILNDGREVIGRVAQGGFIPLFITIGRLSGERGWCVVIRDIAHWKRIEEDLVNARRQAEAASLHKSRFLANISHELRTPLNAIIGFADVMASECFGPIGNERYLEYLGDIKRSGHHVLDLVNDLLDISKIEAGKLDLAFEAVSLNEVVSEVVSLMQPQANRERVIVRSNLPSSVPPVVADRRSIRQIALNLVANAIRFTPAGGQIIASTTYTADGDVLLRFRDSGIGMTEREIEIALTPFQQVHAPSANRGEGTGLGLPLTKAMVEANRAQFAISSAPNEGTLVEISFPSQRVLAD